MVTSPRDLAPLDYERPSKDIPWWERLPQWWRKPLFVSAVWIAAYGAAYFRTMSYGTNVRTIIAGLVLAVVVTLPIIAVVSLGVPNRRGLVRWLIVVVLSVAVAEGWAEAQEWSFTRKCRSLPPGASAWEDRWWPFVDHHIGYDPTFGYYGQD
jgi:hypothetical protein